MNPKKDRQHLHVRVKPLTSEKLKAWADELGISIGETIDQIVDGYEDYCHKEDDAIEREDIHYTLERLIEKVDAISDRI